MRIGNRELTREQVLQRVGNVSQLGGTRHYILNDGRTKGTAAVDVDTGSGLRFTVLPDRGMDMSCASFRGTNLVYLTPMGETNPTFYESQGEGWLRTWAAGLLTTCGLTYLGCPGRDGDQELGLHGRHSTTPARQFRDDSRWDGDEYRIALTGTMEDAVLMGDKIRLTRTISTSIGSRSLLVHDVVENFGYETCPFTILYHINIGYPLLDENSELLVSSAKATPYEEWADVGAMRRFSPPVPGCREENFEHMMEARPDGLAYAAVVNKELDGGLGLYARFDPRTLPYLNEWKMMGQGDYVTAIEPCNVPCMNRGVLRERGLLRFLEPGEQKVIDLEIGVVIGD